jgi:hypothetical protein
MNVKLPLLHIMALGFGMASLVTRLPQKDATLTTTKMLAINFYVSTQAKVLTPTPHLNTHKSAFLPKRALKGRQQGKVAEVEV